MKKVRLRIDQRLVELNLAEDTAKAKALLMAGEVFVNQKRVDKAGTQVTPQDVVEVRSRSLPFASRGGFKLQKALDTFAIEVTGLTVADIGASNGGFTDCLLQRGAGQVYAIDVGYGQLAPKLSQDERVIVRDRTNARFLTPADFPAPLDLITVDASFIALALLLPTLKPLLHERGQLIGLIKPQFEARAAEVGKGGVVRDSAVHRRILQEMRETAEQLHFEMIDLTFSPLKGPAGNIEFLGLFSRNSQQEGINAEYVERVVKEAHAQLDS